jgi:ribonuclease HI
MLKWVKGHSGHERSKVADQMGNLGTQKEHPDEINLTIQPKTQCNLNQRRAMTQMIDQIQNEV